jgi:hypothetical protein
MLKRRRIAATRPFARHEPGEIVTARVSNPLENPGTKGKSRPAILLKREGARWLVMGLTTRSHFADGTPRRYVPSSMASGLAGKAYLWGRFTWICTLDVGDHIGRASPELLALIAAD